jgi:transmembrane and coiled-coil domain-containing protein 7
MAHHYSKKLIDCFLRAIQDEDVSIRVSSISNLGQLCMVLRYGLSYYIAEIVHAIQCLIQTDQEMNVRRACVMFIYMLMSGLDKNTFQVSKLSPTFLI